MNKSSFELFRLAELQARRSLAQRYLEFLRVDSMSVGIYVLAAASEDTQLPHREDEIYVVLEGRARFQAGTEDRELAGGEVLYVAAGVDHRFHHIEQQLTLLVLFAPAESAESAVVAPVSNEPG